MTTTDKINYDKIYEALDNWTSTVVSASGLARKIGVERIYGATMTKLVREGLLTPAPTKGLYWHVRNREQKMCFVGPCPEWSMR